MRVSQQITFAFATLGLAASTGCPASKPAETPAPAVGKPEAPPPKFESRPECVGRPATTPEETFEVSGRKYVRKGSTVTIEGADADDEFIVGHLTDVKDHTPENVANLKAVTDWMKGEKVDAVVISGDLGESAPSVQGVAEDVAALGVPVLVVIGNRECAKDFNAGIQAAQAKFKNIINMDEVRVFNTDDVSFVVACADTVACGPATEIVPASARTPGLAAAKGWPAADPATEMVTGTGTVNANVPSALGVATPYAAMDCAAVAEVSEPLSRGTSKLVTPMNVEFGANERNVW